MIIDKYFQLEKYGLQVRLVNEEDAEYIVSLRTDSRLGKFLNSTQNDVENQKKWIRDYKRREEIGLDYYFIYLHKGQRIGVNRIYNIHGKTATSGSWICSNDLPYELPLLTVMIVREIFFDVLGLEIDLFDIRKNNKKVIKMHLLLGSHSIYENEIDVFHYITKNDYIINKAKFLKYLDIN